MEGRLQHRELREGASPWAGAVGGDTSWTSAEGVSARILPPRVLREGRVSGIQPPGRSPLRGGAAHLPTTFVVGLSVAIKALDPSV